MKTLPTTFKNRGFEFEQLKRAGDVAVYRKKRPNHREWSFETIIVQRHNGYTLAGSFVEPAETFPSSETWAHTGGLIKTKRTPSPRWIHFLDFDL